MPTSVALRVQKRRTALRMAGLRPVQIWVPDTRGIGFAAECQRQSALAAKSDLTDTDMMNFIDEAPLFRIGVQPSETNGLRKPSQIMVDKILTIKSDKLGAAIGKASDELMIEVSRSLAVFLGIVR